MKLTKTILGLFIASIAIIACNDNSDYNFQSDNKVNFSAQISASVTRATSDSWEADDAIGIYALTAGETLSDAAIYDQKANIKYTTNSAGATGKLTPANEDEAIKFPANGDNLDFIAYYPYTGNITKFKIPVDISNQSDISKIDLLYATKAEQNKDNEKVELQFAHKLSRVIVELSEQNGVDLTDATITLKGVTVKGAFDLDNGTVTAKTDVADVTPYKKANKATAILLPGQDVSVMKIEIVLKDGTKYEWTPAQYILKEGKSITYSLVLISGNAVTLDADATIEDWKVEAGQNETLTPKEEVNNEVTVDKTSLEFAAAGGEKTVNITANENKSWTATSDANWLTLNTANQTGNFALKLTATENTTTEQRTTTVTIEDKTVTVTQKGKGTTTPTTDLLFPGADFEDWVAFEGSLNKYGVKYAVQSNDGRNGSKALYIGENEELKTKYGYIFTAKVPENFNVPSKIHFYIKGTSTGGKSATFYIKATDGKNRYFNLKNCTAETTITPTKSVKYDGTINTNGEWVKITLDLSTIQDVIPTTAGEDLIVFKLGKSTYDLYVDDITVE